MDHNGKEKLNAKESDLFSPLLLGTAALSASPHLNSREFVGTAGRQLKQVSDQGGLLDRKCSVLWNPRNSTPKPVEMQRNTEHRGASVTDWCRNTGGERHSAKKGTKQGWCQGTARQVLQRYRCSPTWHRILPKRETGPKIIPGNAGMGQDNLQGGAPRFGCLSYARTNSCLSGQGAALCHFPAQQSYSSKETWKSKQASERKSAFQFYALGFPTPSRGQRAPPKLTSQWMTNTWI